MFYIFTRPGKSRTELYHPDQKKKKKMIRRINGVIMERLELVGLKIQNSRFNLLTIHQIHLAHRFYVVTISLKYSYYKLTKLFHVYLALNWQLTYFHFTTSINKWLKWIFFIFPRHDWFAAYWLVGMSLFSYLAVNPPTAAPSIVKRDPSGAHTPDSTLGHHPSSS